MTTTAAPETAKDSTTLTISRQSLKTALGRLSAAVDMTSKALPVAQHIRFDVAPGRLTLTATDFEVFVRLHVSCDASGTTALLLPAKRLIEIVGALPPATVSLALSSTGAVLTAGRSRFELPAMSVVEFPPVPELMSGARTARVQAATFLDAIERAATHASTQDARPSLMVVHLVEQDGALVAEGGDTLRYARLPAGGVDGALPGGCSMPRTVPTLLGRVFAGLPDAATLTLTKDEHRLVVEGDEAMASVRLVLQDFPDHAPILRRLQPTRVVTCDRTLLASAVRRAAIAAPFDVKRVHLSIAEEITVSSAASDTGKALDVVPIDEVRIGDTSPVLIAASGTALLAALDVLTAQAVAISVASPTQPLLITAADQVPTDPTLLLLTVLRPEIGS